MDGSSPRSSPSTSSETEHSISETDEEKKSKEEEEESRDRISELSHSIRLSILALLPLREAAKTSVLSKLWRQSWTFHPNLDLRKANVFRDGESNSIGLASAEGSACSGRNDDEDEKSLSLNTKKYVDAVEHIVRVHQNSKVDSFRIHFELRCGHISYLQRWIDRAAAFSPEVIDIKITGKTGPAAFGPTSLYTFSASEFEAGRSRLRYLRLQCCKVVVPPPFGGFRSLTTLVLEHSWVADEDLNRLFSKCSSLGSVEIAKCEGLTRLKVDSSSTDKLRYLTVTRCLNLETMEIVDPGKLSRFSYEGIFGKFNVRGSENCARVDYVPNQGSNFFTLPNLTRKLQELTLRISYPCEPMQAFKGIPVMKHLRLLKLEGWTENEKDMNWVFLLTNECPFLEELIIDMHFTGTFGGDSTHQEMDNFTKRHHFYLREVTIVGLYDRYERLIDLAVHLLTHAVRLRKMTINGPTSGRMSRRVCDLLRERAAAGVELVFHGIIE